MIRARAPIQSGGFLVSGYGGNGVLYQLKLAVHALQPVFLCLDVDGRRDSDIG